MPPCPGMFTSSSNRSGVNRWQSDIASSDVLASPTSSHLLPFCEIIEKSDSPVRRCSSAMAMRRERADELRLSVGFKDCGNYGHKAPTVTRFSGRVYTDFPVVKNTTSPVCSATPNFGKTMLLENILF